MRAHFPPMKFVFDSPAPYALNLLLVLVLVFESFFWVLLFSFLTFALLNSTNFAIWLVPGRIAAPVYTGIWFSFAFIFYNRPFPSSLASLFQSESKCETSLMKMTSICMKMKLHACRTHFRTWTRFEREAQENSEWHTTHYRSGRSRNSQGNLKEMLSNVLPHLIKLFFHLLKDGCNRFVWRCRWWSL